MRIPIKQFLWLFVSWWLLWNMLDLLFTQKFYFFGTLVFPVLILLFSIVYFFPGIAISYFAFLKIKDAKCRVLLLSFLMALSMYFIHAFISSDYLIGKFSGSGSFGYTLFFFPVYVFMLLPSVFLTLLIIPKRIFVLKWYAFFIILLIFVFVLCICLIVNTF